MSSKKEIFEIKFKPNLRDFQVIFDIRTRPLYAPSPVGAYEVLAFGNHLIDRQLDMIKKLEGLTLGMCNYSGDGPGQNQYLGLISSNEHDVVCKSVLGLNDVASLNPFKKEFFESVCEDVYAKYGKSLRDELIEFYAISAHLEQRESGFVSPLISISKPQVPFLDDRLDSLLDDLSESKQNIFDSNLENFDIVKELKLAKGIKKRKRQLEKLF